MAQGSAARERPWVPARALALAREPSGKAPHWHPTEAGFGIRVSPKGKAVWVYRFRDGFGKEQSGTIGPIAAVSTAAGAYSLDDALERFRKLRSYHIDKAAPGAITLAAAFDVWMRDHRKKDGGALAGETVAYYREAYDRYLRDEAADWLLSRTTTEAWVGVLRKAKAKSVHQARGTMWLLRSIYAHYCELEVLDKNPLAKRIVRSLFSGADTKTRKTRHVKAIDLPHFCAGVQRIRQSTPRDAVRMLLLTGWRLGGVCRMEWKHIDWQQGVYAVQPGSHGWKGYSGPIALNDFALEILQARKDAHGEAFSEYVFPGRHGDLEAKPWLGDVRGSCETASRGLHYRITAHDLRRTFITVGEMVLGGRLRLLGMLVGHKQGIIGSGDDSAITASYVMRGLERERAASTAIARALLEMGGLLPISAATEALLQAEGESAAALQLTRADDVDDSDAE